MAADPAVASSRAAGGHAGVRRRLARRLALLGLALLCGAVACTRPDNRRATPTTASAHRIVSVVPAVTEMLFAIGAGDDVVGVSSYDTDPPEVATRPRVGALVDPDFERILTLRPDLVVAFSTQQDFIARLARAHIPIFEYKDGGLPDIVATIRRLGDRIGRHAAGAAVAAGLDHRFEAVRAAVRGRPRPRTLLVFGRDPGALTGIYASGGLGFLHDVLDLAGGDDVLGDIRQQSVPVSTEMLLQRKPDVIIELHASDWPAADGAAGAHVWQQLPALPAVRAGAVHVLANDLFVVPGPRIAEAARRLAIVLHPDAASALEP